ncbi:DUF4184 family protein [Morganella morganii]
MPWTFSHPAVVFPLKQSCFGLWLNLPALITGSVSSDLLSLRHFFRLSESVNT